MVEVIAGALGLTGQAVDLRHDPPLLSERRQRKLVTAYTSSNTLGLSPVALRLRERNKLKRH